MEILLADDDPDDRDFFVEAVSQSNLSFAVNEVENGQQLMELLSTVTDPPPPDIIFLDINMPYKNGKICLREIRSNKKFNNVPVVMFSTSFHNKDVDDAFDAGANMYVSKSDFFEDEAGMLNKIFPENWQELWKYRTKENFVLKN
ncbi:MAG: response regulator [Chitinophagales bacterium]